MPKKIKERRVTVTYKVGYGDIEITDAILKELKTAVDNGDTIDMHDDKYPIASYWLQQNMDEEDSMEWTAEIEDMVLPKKKKKPAPEKVINIADETFKEVRRIK